MIISQQYRPYWSLSARIVFRFAFLFFVGFIVLMPGRFLVSPLLVWIGENVFETDGRLELMSTGSGDDTMAWLSLFLQAVIAVIGTILWTLIDYKRASYNKLQYWFIVTLRVFLIFFMITYGMVKVFKIQFMDPSLLRLLQPVGDMSPMGLAWTYMGHSNAFNVFVGFAEVLGGLLLIPKRTQTLGALIVVGVMTHVAVMNFTYDIPVKIFSVHLVMMALYVFLTDSKRFSDVFLKNKPAKTVHYYNPASGKTWNKVVVISKWSLGMTMMVVFTIGGFIGEYNVGHKRDKPEYYGIWNVEKHIVNGDTIPALFTSSNRWRYVVLDNEGVVSVITGNDSIIDYNFILDSTKTSVKFYAKDSEPATENFKITVGDSTRLLLNGVMNSDSIKVELKAIDLNSFTLLNRGFHWVNETPYNK